MSIVNTCKQNLCKKEKERTDLRWIKTVKIEFMDEKNYVFDWESLPPRPSILPAPANPIDFTLGE